MFFNFIEIGTSDFNTLIQEADDTCAGLSIDPIELYIDRLPTPKNCHKLIAAVSNFDGESQAFYVTPENIVKYNLPDWIRGCNSIGSGHPTVISALKEKNIEFCEAVSVARIPVYKLSTVFEKYDIEGLFFLKVDTEGHDAVILEDFFNYCPATHLPHRLLFESNILNDSKRIHHLIAKLLMLGYDIIKIEAGGGESDTYLKLNINRLKGRSIFNRTSSGYYLRHYPDEYDPNAPPHGSSLLEAQEYCQKIDASGVTFQYGRFEVRKGDFLYFDKEDMSIHSWVYV